MDVQFESIIKSYYDNLSKAEKRIATVLLKDQTKSVHMTGSVAKF